MFSINEFFELIDDETALKSPVVRKQLKQQNYNISVVKESYDHYKIILKKYAELASKFGLTNSLHISMFFTYLLWNGYFSQSKENIYTNIDTINIDGIFPFDVIRGRGTCLNYSSMLRDFLIQCGFESSVLISKMEEKIILRNNFGIERKCSELKKISFLDFVQSMIVSLKFGNHALNLIKENNNIYAYDCTNLTFLNINNLNTARIVNGSGILKLSPFVSLCCNLPKKSRDLLKLFYEKDKFSCCYDKKYFIETFKELIKFLDLNKDILDDYYKLVKEDIKFVAGTADDIEDKKIVF